MIILPTILRIIGIQERGIPFLTNQYPLVNIQKAIENGPVEIVDFPINSMVIFHSKMLVHQRVYPINIPLNHYKSH